MMPLDASVVGAISFTDSDTRVVDMYRRLAAYDFDGALQLAREVLVDHPGHSAALEVVGECQSAMKELYEFAFASRALVPARVRATVPVDPVFLYVHGLVDGVHTVEEIARKSTLPESVVVHAVFALVKCGAIIVR